MTTTEPARTRSGAFVDLDGVATYYEATGTGPPLVLLHGGLCPAESFDPLVPALAARYRVFVPERHGHGRTRDVEGPLTYEGMAQHTIAFLDALGIESADLVGWSDGGLVALLVALRRPKLVHKVVVIEQFVTLDGARPEVIGFLEGISVDSAPPAFVELYRALSPDGPDHLPVVLEKLRVLWTSPTGVEVADLSHLTAPTLVLAADDGGMILEHLAAVGRALPDVQLAVVPGTSHGVYFEKPHVVTQLLFDFLADEQVPKLF